LPFFVLLLFSICLGPGVVFELAEFFELHEFRRSASKIIETVRGLHTQAISERIGTQSGQHVVHCHLGAEVANAHGSFAKPIDERSQGFSLLLANAD